MSKLVSKKLRALLLIEYEVEPEHYENQDPRKMIELDIEVDSAATIMNSEWSIVSAELKDV